MRLILFVFIIFSVIQSEAAFSTRINLSQFDLKISQGLAWQSTFKAVVANLAEHEVLIITGSKALSFEASASATGAGEAALFEAPTTSANGSALPNININRESSNVPTFTVFSTPTVSANGTLLGEALVPGDSKKSEFGGDIEGGLFILKPNTKYLLQVINTSGGNATIILRFNAFE